MTQTDAGVVRKQIIVDAAIDRAFTVFTERFGDFKPPEHNLLRAPIAETVFEPHVGGNIVDRAVDGSECRWARILAYEPPHRVVFSWDISPRWEIVTDPAPGQRGRGAVLHRHPGPDPGGTGAPAHRPARTRMAGRHRRCRRRRGLAALPGPLRRPVHRGRRGLMAPITTSTEIDRPATEVFDYATDPTRFNQWQNGVVDGHMDQAGNPAGRSPLHDHPPHRRGGPVVHFHGDAYRPTQNLGRPRDRRTDPGHGRPHRRTTRRHRSRLTIAVDFEGHGIGTILVPLLVRREAQKEMPANGRQMETAFDLVVDRTGPGWMCPRCGPCSGSVSGPGPAVTICRLDKQS